MLLIELFNPMPAGYSTDTDDQSVLTLGDLRKTRLTLGQLHKLRQMNDVKKYEHEEKLKAISQQYAPAQSAEMPGI